jgi:hypothetical protein
MAALRERIEDHNTCRAMTHPTSLLSLMRSTPRMQWNDGYSTDTGPSRGDPCRRALRPFLPFGERSLSALASLMIVSE